MCKKSQLSNTHAPAITYALVLVTVGKEVIKVTVIPQTHIMLDDPLNRKEQRRCFGGRRWAVQQINKNCFTHFDLVSLVLQSENKLHDTNSIKLERPWLYIWKIKSDGKNFNARTKDHFTEHSVKK